MKRRTHRNTRRRRVLIVNGVSIWRESITRHINRCRDLKVCGEAVGEQAAVEKIRRLRPHLVLTEILRAHDLGFIKEMVQRHPRLRVLVFSFRDEEAYAPLALEAGARGYLPKGVHGETLVAGIRKALNGGVVLTRHMAARLSTGASRSAAVRHFAETGQGRAENGSARG